MTDVRAFDRPEEKIENEGRTWSGFKEQVRVRVTVRVRVRVRARVRVRMRVKDK